MLKTCSKCGIPKSLEEFHKLSSSKDGKRPDCKTCCKKVRKKFASDNPVKDRTNRMAHGILQRTRYETNDRKNKSYKENNVQCLLGNTFSEISNFLYDHFYSEINALIVEGKVPSVDRIDSKKDYSQDNIRIIDLDDNTADGRMNAVKKTSKPIRAICKGTIQEFPSVSAGAKSLGIKRDTILAHLDKGTTTQKGYKFETIF